MIILRHLHLENFTCIDSLDMDFDNNTIISISGDNGAGKSATIDALALCICGYRRGESYRSYVKVGADSAIVVLDAFLNGEPIHYDLEIRAEGRSGNPLKRVVTYKGNTYQNSDYTAFMKEYSLDYIENLMFLFQGNSSLIDSKPSERAATLRRLFQFEFKDVVNSLQAKSDTYKTEEIETNAVLNELKSRSYNRLTLSREPTQAQIESWEEEINKLNKDLNSIEDVEVKDYTVLIEGYKRKNNNYRNEINNCNIGIEEASEKIKKIEEFLDSYEDIEDPSDKIDEKNKLIRNLEKELSVVDYSIREINDQLEISAKGVCHACGQPIDENHLIKLNEKKDELISNRESIGSKLKEEKVILKSLNEDLKRIEQYNKAITERKSYVDKLSSLKEAIGYREEYINFNEKEISKLEKSQAEYEKLIPIINKREELKARRDEYEIKVNSAKELIISNRERKKSNELVIKEERARDVQVNKLSKKLNDISLQLNTTKQCIDIFDSQFPNYILLRACGQLEEYINFIIGSVFEGFTVRLNQSRGGVSFFYRPTEESEDWLPVCMASGAQKTILSLAYTVALGKMYGLSSILLDEVDSACTAETAKIIYKFIASLEGFDQIIFISHRPESREGMRESGRENIVYYYVHDGQYEQITEN